MCPVIISMQFQGQVMNSKKELRELRGNYVGNLYISIYLSINQSFIYIFSCLVPQVPQKHTFIDLKYGCFFRKHENAKAEKIKGTWGTKKFSCIQVFDYISFLKGKLVPKARELKAKFQGTSLILERK